MYFNSFIFETLIIKKYYRHKKRNVVLTHLKNNNETDIIILEFPDRIIRNITFVTRAIT